MLAQMAKAGQAATQPISDVTAPYARNGLGMLPADVKPNNKQTTSRTNNGVHYPLLSLYLTWISVLADRYFIEI
jgi:hypothetical protein